ncbi:MAG: hypothetical protein ABIP51_07620, partial [Bacteroidia bacterium]
MTHKQILDKLSAASIVESIDDDLSRLTFNAMCYHKTHKEQQSYVLPKLLLRWNCVLNDKKDITDTYKQITILVLAVSLHKYGFVDKTITAKALKAVDSLNKEVVLSDDFFRKSDAIKKMIAEEPKPLSRKPSTAKSITFYRPFDVISFQLENNFYAAYIHSHSGTNESPVIEFYDAIFKEVPKLKDLEKLKAKGEVYKDGIARKRFFAVFGMKLIPDAANQVHIIGSEIKRKPINDHLEEA